jgi:large subunit ribosomal protein L10
VSLNREGKQAVVGEIAAQVAKSQGIVVAEYRGLTVGAMTDLRRQARSSGVYLRVLKNTLARRAVKGTPFEVLSDKLVGPLIYGMSGDPVATAKVLNEFARTNENFVIKGGAIPNSVISPAEVKALATLPSREQLLAMLMGTMRAPIQKFVATLNEVPARLVRTLAAVRDQKEKAPA